MSIPLVQIYTVEVCCVFFFITYHVHVHRLLVLWCISTNIPSLIVDLLIQENPCKKQTVKPKPLETGLQVIRTQSVRELVIYGQQIYGVASPL